jgi:hypothetical protein
LCFAKKSLTKTEGLLECCREGETNCWFSIFPSDRDEPTYETGISLMQQL